MPEWNRLVMDHLLRQDPRPTVLLACRWSYQPKPELGPALAKTLLALQPSGSSRELMLLSEVPVYPFDPRKALLRARLFAQPSDDLGLTRTEYLAQNELIVALAQPLAQQRLKILDPTECFFAGRQRARVELDGLSCYWDDNHLSPQGATLLSPLLDPLVAGAVAR